jgi:NADH:ubiquinone oxidoreductase subunit H
LFFFSFMFSVIFLGGWETFYIFNDLYNYN